MVVNTLVISAINFFEGGPLSVLKDCLNYLNSQQRIPGLKTLALVHKRDLFDVSEFPNIEFIEFPKSRQSYLYRLYYEYIYFKKIAKKHQVSFWLSLHDITPNIGNIQQAVYCHNPSPFNSLNYRDIYLQPTQFFFRLFYKYIYGVNIRRNKYVIVQQLWMKKAFVKNYNLNPLKVITATPQVPQIDIKPATQSNTGNIVFLYPAFPRPFKNFEVICEAVKILENDKINNFEVVLTIDGTENKYASSILSKYGQLSSIKFVGLISREKVFDYYQSVHCLLFPSTLETWGLPISEFKQYGKSMIVSDLPYARETVGKYDKVSFFNAKDARSLASFMKAAINNNQKFHKTAVISYPKPHSSNWDELFTSLFS